MSGQQAPLVDMKLFSRARLGMVYIPSKAAYLSFASGHPIPPNKILVSLFENTISTKMVCQSLTYILLFLVKIAVTIRVPFSTDDNKYKDCTRNLTNRMATFEYHYYPGYWLYPAAADGIRSGLKMAWMNVDDAKSYEKTWAKWIIHQSPYDENKAFLESARDGYNDYYLIGSRYRYYSHLNDVPKQRQMSILCTNCPNEKEEFQDCVLEQMGAYLYSIYHPLTYYYFLFTSEKTSPYGTKTHNSWFRFRIYSPPTIVAWKEAFRHSNCNSSIAVHYQETFKSSVTSTTKEGSKITTEVSAKWGPTFLKLLNSFEVSGKVTNEWSMEKINEYSEERTTTIGGAYGHPVPPNKIWVGYQKVGRAGNMKIKSLQTKTEMEDC